MAIKFDKDSLTVEENNYSTEIVNCLFLATNIVKNSDKTRWIYSAYGITFDREGWWSFGNGTARNVIILVLVVIHHHILTIAETTFDIRFRSNFWN